MPGNRTAGDEGEKEVVSLISCPNCKNKLMTLPSNYPLFDVQCTGCSFRAQVKTNKSKPRNEIFGAGWEVIDKVIRSGYMVPPLIANFKWIEEGKQKQKILFYPFVPRLNLKKRQLSEKARRANYKMFNYVGLSKLPYFLLFESK